MARQRFAPISSAYFFSNSDTTFALDHTPLRSTDNSRSSSAALSHIGQRGRQRLVLTALPPLIASLPAFLLAIPEVGSTAEVTAAIVPADAALKNCLLLNLFLFILSILHSSALFSLSYKFILLSIAPISWPLQGLSPLLRSYTDLRSSKTDTPVVRILPA